LGGISARLFYQRKEERKEGRTWEETEEEVGGDKESLLLDT